MTRVTLDATDVFVHGDFEDGRPVIFIESRDGTVVALVGDPDMIRGVGQTIGGIVDDLTGET